MSSVAEIEAAIEKLEPNEVKAVASWLAKHLTAQQEQDSSAGAATDFDQATNGVFEHFAPLLEELSK